MTRPQRGWKGGVVPVARIGPRGHPSDRDTLGVGNQDDAVRASEKTVRLLSLDDLELRGSSRDDVRRRVAGGELVRVRRGTFVAASEWEAQYIEGRHRARARAYAARSPETVFALESAASQHRLPLFRVKEERLQIVTHDRAASSTKNVIRHRFALDDADVVLVDGVRVTSLSRTVFDLIRKLPSEAGVALADAALKRAEGMRPGGAEELRAKVRERLDRAPGARGIRRARIVLAFADGRSGSAGESASRWFLRVIGFRRFELQIPFAGPEGQKYEVDLEFDGNLGEFDGKVKYSDPAFLDGCSPEQALLDEKERGDWIRGRSRRPYVRWMDQHIATVDTLGRRLARFGIRP